MAENDNTHNNNNNGSSNKDLQTILAALNAAQHQGTPVQQSSVPPTRPYSTASPTPAMAHSGMPPAPVYSGSIYPLPQPASSGNLDLSNVLPVGSGTLTMSDAIIPSARAGYAAENPAAAAALYDRPAGYGHLARAATDSYKNSRSRSRSPGPRRDGGYRDGGHRDTTNPYRDERRDRGRQRDFGNRPHSRDREPARGGGGGRGRSGNHPSDENTEIIRIEPSLVGLIIGRQGENLRRIEAESGCRVQFLPAPENTGSFRQCKITGPAPKRAEVKAAVDKIIDDNGMAALNRQPHERREGRPGPYPGPDSSPGPGPSLGGGAGPELRDGEDHVKMMVPDRTVGLIIGRGGETIRDLQDKSGCHINIVDEKLSVDGLRPVNLIGSPSAAERARILILQIVETDNQAHQDRAGVGLGNRAPAGGLDMARGGPGGGGIGGGGNHHQHHIGGGGPGGPGAGGGHDRTSDRINVPSDSVGMIIGRGGETIREIQQVTGCKINVIPAGPGAAPDALREIHLIGPRDSVERAKVAIGEKADIARQRSSGGGGGGREGGAGFGGGPRGRPTNQNYNQPYGGRTGKENDGGGGGYATSAASTNSPAQTATSNSMAAQLSPADPYAIYGGYDRYAAAYWLYMQQQQRGGAAGPDGSGPTGA